MFWFHPGVVKLKKTLTSHEIGTSWDEKERQAQNQITEDNDDGTDGDEPHMGRNTCQSTR